jgi:hypothetical protein
MPVPDPTEATEVLVLLQVPPLTVLASVLLDAWQILVLPDIAVGAAFTVTNLETAHPLGSV